MPESVPSSITTSRIRQPRKAKIERWFRTLNDFYRNLIHEPGAEPAFKKPDNFRMIQEEITRLSVEKRKTSVIIMDEANYIGNGILNDLKILFNFEMDSRDRAVVLLAGLPKRNSTLCLGIHEPLKLL